MTVYVALQPALSRKPALTIFPSALDLVLLIPSYQFLICTSLAMQKVIYRK